MPLDQPRWMAATFRCMGCEAVETAMNSIPGHQKGGYAGLIPFNDEEDEDEDAPPLDPFAQFPTLEDDV